MTIEDVGLEPAFDVIEPEQEDDSTTLAEMTLEDDTAVVNKKKKVKKSKKTSPAARAVDSLPEQSSAKKTKKAVKRPATIPTVEKEGGVEVVAPTGEPPKKLNRKQTKLLKREMYKKLAETGEVPENLKQAALATEISVPSVSDNKEPVENKTSLLKKTKKEKKSKSAPEGGEKKADGAAKPPKPQKEWVDYAALDEKFKPTLEKMVDIETELEAKNLVLEEISKGQVENTELALVLQRWRQQKRRLAHSARIEKVVEMDGDLEDVKTVVNELVRKRKLTRDEAAEVIIKWRNRERRRLSRQNDKLLNRTCFHCRLSGHVLADCPNKEEEGTGGAEGICFKCGSGDHSIYTCPKKNIRGFPFATCFVCNQDGHLSRDCEKNRSGIYPDGGSCNVCGSQKHLKRDCPELEIQKKGKERKVIAQTMTAMSRADDDYEPVEGEEKNTPAATNETKKQKVVNF